VRDVEAMTVVLVHGAGGGGWMWESLCAQLDAQGIEHVAVDLPSVGAGADPKLDAHSDAAYVRGVLDEIGGPVLLCGNSYGGVVITEASAGHTGVRRLVYLAAFMPDTDDAFPGFFTDNSTPEFLSGVIFGDDGLVSFDPELVKRLAFQQASPRIASAAVGQLRPMAMGMSGSPTLSGAGWHDIASTYVVCSEDRSILPDSQRRWGKERATDSVELPFDHCPHVSHPAEIAGLLAELATSPAP
jgi:pimeloyl-ACP methyl ester carboxylesterase